MNGESRMETATILRWESGPRCEDAEQAGAIPKAEDPLCRCCGGKRGNTARRQNLIVRWGEEFRNHNSGSNLEGLDYG